MTLPLERLKTYALAERENLVSREGFARATLPPPGAVRALLDSMPDLLGARALRRLAAAIVEAKRAGAPVIFGLGAHVLKVGLSPLLVDLVERGFVQGVALNGAGAIHDAELALIGATSEDVASALKDGSFGMARDTADFLNGAVQRGAAQKLGFGEAVAVAIDGASGARFKELSLLWNCWKRKLPATVHVTLGADIVHMHPSADGAAIGAASLADFRRFSELVSKLQGGVYVNVGSAVTLPEVFLKALAIARNLGATVDRFTTANLDQLPHYRPKVNVLDRPAGGQSYDLRGHHEILLPLLRWLVLDPGGAEGVIEAIDALLRRLERRKVLVIGDLILDRYVSGDVPRISPEAPVPVVHVSAEEDRVGGAANVAANVASLLGKPLLVGVCGRDEAGRILKERMRAAGVPVTGVRIDPSRPTIEKTRILARHQQMLRVDREEPAAIGAAVEAKVVAGLAALRGKVGTIVLSDYAKGLLTPRVIAAACRLGAEVLVDPKGRDFSRYRGAQGITPNAAEAEAATGCATATVAGCRAAAKSLLEELALRWVVITRGPHGIYYLTADGEEGDVPTRARTVFDVTGAGDTVIAVLALARAAGLPLGEAVELANAAAGLVVEKLGAATVTPAELASALAHGFSTTTKVTTRDGAVALARRLRAEGRRVVLTNGCFDLIHAGHVHSLEFARSQGDALLVAVNDDASVRRAKGAVRPVQELEHRLRVLAALACVDAAFPFFEDTPDGVVRAISPDVLVKGEDWKQKGVVGRDHVEAKGGRVVLAPLLKGFSTSRIIERIRGEEA